MNGPVLQVDEVLQVELSAVLSEIDGVYVLEQTKMTTGQTAVTVCSGATESQIKFSLFQKSKEDRED